MENEVKIDENDIKINKKKRFNLLSKLLETTKSKVIFIFAVVLIISIALVVIGNKIFNKEASADFTHLNMLLEKSSELTTAKLKITGIENYKDAGAMIINRSDFTMVYSATIRAGVELKEVKIEPNTIAKEIVVVMPRAKVFDCHVDQNEIQYFDEKFALFNVDSKEDANKACALAEQDGIREAEATGILEFAETEAEYVIKDILTPALPDGYTLTVKKADK